MRHCSPRCNRTKLDTVNRVIICNSVKRCNSTLCLLRRESGTRLGTCTTRNIFIQHYMIFSIQQTRTTEYIIVDWVVILCVFIDIMLLRINLIKFIWCDLPQQMSFCGYNEILQLLHIPKDLMVALLYIMSTGCLCVSSWHLESIYSRSHGITLHCATLSIWNFTYHHLQAWCHIHLVHGGSDLQWSH